MIIKKGLVYKGKLYIRIPFKLSDQTICNSVKCKYGRKDKYYNVLQKNDKNNECIMCGLARRSLILDTLTYSFVPYDN